MVSFGVYVDGLLVTLRFSYLLSITVRNCSTESLENSIFLHYQLSSLAMNARPSGVVGHSKKVFDRVRSRIRP